MICVFVFVFVCVYVCGVWCVYACVRVLLCYGVCCVVGVWCLVDRERLCMHKCTRCTVVCMHA